MRKSVNIIEIRNTLTADDFRRLYYGYKITDDDLKTKCWWCGKPVVGFDKATGRDRKPYHEHYCNLVCENNFDAAAKLRETSLI